MFVASLSFSSAAALALVTASCSSTFFFLRSAMRSFPALTVSPRRGRPIFLGTGGGERDEWGRRAVLVTVAWGVMGGSVKASSGAAATGLTSDWGAVRMTAGGRKVLALEKGPTRVRPWPPGMRMAPAWAPGALGSNRRMPVAALETVAAWPGLQSSDGCREEKLVSREEKSMGKEPASTEEPDTMVLLGAVAGTGGSQDKSLE